MKDKHLVIDNIIKSFFCEIIEVGFISTLFRTDICCRFFLLASAIKISATPGDLLPNVAKSLLFLLSPGFRACLPAGDVM